MSNTRLNKPGCGDASGGLYFPVPRAKVAISEISSWGISRTIIVWMTAIVLLSLASGTAAALNAVAPDSLSSNQTVLHADDQISRGTVYKSSGSNNGNSNGCNTKPCGCGGCNLASGSTPSSTISGLLLLFCLSMTLVNAIGSWPFIPPQALKRAASPGHGNRINKSPATSWRIPGPLIVPIMAIIFLSFTIQAAAEPAEPRPVSRSTNQTILHGYQATSIIYTIRDSNPRAGSGGGGGGAAAIGAAGIAAGVAASGSTFSKVSPGLLFLLLPFTALAKAVSTSLTHTAANVHRVSVFRSWESSQPAGKMAFACKFPVEYDKYQHGA